MSKKGNSPVASIYVVMPETLQTRFRCENPSSHHDFFSGIFFFSLKTESVCFSRA